MGVGMEPGWLILVLGRIVGEHIDVTAIEFTCEIWPVHEWRVSSG